MPTEQNVVRNDAITDIRFPIRLLSLVCLLTIMGFAGLGWHVFDARRDAEMFADRVSRIERLRGVVVHLDEVLTMSARMAAATGDLQWEKRYRYFELQLDAAIKETTKIGTRSPDIKAATKTDEANTKLVEMENRAFALVRADRKEEARALLFSSEYEAEKKIYAEGIKIFTDQIRHEFDESLRADQRIDLFSMIAAMAVGGASFVAWLSAARGVRRWRAQLLESFHRHTEAEENLRKAHAGLEVRVNERTADLANANEALRSENTERRRGDDALRASEEKFRQLADHITDVFWMTTPDMQQIDYVSPAYEQVWGRSRKSLLADPTQWVAAVLPEERKHVFSAFAGLGEGESSVSIEYRISRPDGTIRWLHDRGFVVRDAAGKAIRHAGIATDITERKQLERQREQLAAIVEASPDFIGFADSKTAQIQYINKHGRRMCGIGKDEDIGKLKISDVHPAWMNKRMTEVVLPAALRDGLWEGEGAFLHRNGREIPVLMSLLARNGADGNVDIFYTISRDITDRKKAEELVRASEERYRNLFESNPSPMWVYDLETLFFLAVNAAAVEHYGYSQDEFLAMTLKDIRPSEDIPALMDDLSKANGDSRNDAQWRHCRKDKTMIDVEVTSHDLVWFERPAKLALINDITERKRAEKRLRQQARLLDLAQDAIMVRDMEDHVEFWNHGAEELYGWTAAEVQGRKASSFLYEDQLASTAAARADVIEKGKWRGECKHNCKDGGTTTVRSRWTLVRDELGAPKSILIINTDVTEQRKLETHLLRAQRLESIGTLASGVAHDLNNILTPILMCTEVLKGNPTREDLPGLVSMIEESARRGANVVKQVLTFARGIEGERVVIKPNHLIQEMVDIARKTFPKTIEILGRYPTDLSSIEADPTQLHQVLLNLSVNARDAMLNGGTLTLAADNFNVDENYASMMPGAKPGPHVMFGVTDTGCGMPRAMIDKIFDPFFTTKEVGKGTGLGLSTTLGIVKSHGGFISVYSEPTKGTTFKLFLPATVIQEGPQQSSISTVTIQGKGELILVVDDEPNILGVTKMILEKHSYDVVSASDGPEALAIFAQQMKSISLVLTDLSMPYMDGIALVRSLKKMQPNVSILASTGQGEQASVAELQSLGVKNFLTKPYNTHRLLAALDDTLHGRESESSKVQTTQVG